MKTHDWFKEQEPLDNKKQIIVRRLLAFVSEYEEKFSRPIPIRVLSAKYSRSLMECGGFPEIIEELVKENKIRVELLLSGAKVVSPVKG